MHREKPELGVSEVELPKVKEAEIESRRRLRHQRSRR